MIVSLLLTRQRERERERDAGGGHYWLGRTYMKVHYRQGRQDNTQGGEHVNRETQRRNTEDMRDSNWKQGMRPQQENRKSK